MFYYQVRLHGGIPFDVRIPNQETLDAMAESENPDTLKKYGSFKQLRDDIGV